MKVASWLFSYKREWLRPDIVAGITVAVVVIPKVMAFAAIAGLPVEVGLYTGLAAMIAYPFFGTSRPLSVSSTSAVAMMTAGSIAVVSAQRAVDPKVVASTLALIVAAALLAAWLLRLGFLSNFISEPVLIGFQAAVGVVIIASQVGAFLGAPGKATTPVAVAKALPAFLTHIHPLTVAVSVACVALLVVLPKLVPKLPAPLVLIAAAVAASYAFDLGKAGVKLVGKVPTGLPSFALPDLSIVLMIWPAALGIALMAFVESVATARAFCVREDPPIDANRELLALGAANALSGFTGGMSASGIPSPTAVAEETGTRSQLSQWVSAGAIVVTLLFLSQFLALLPKPALAAVIIMTGVGLIKPKAFRAIARVRRLELVWALATLFGGVVFDLLEGVIIAVVISIVTLIYMSTRPPVYALVYDREKDAFRPAGDGENVEAFPGLLVLRVEGRLMFANAANVADKLRALVAQSHPRVIVLECSAIIDIEYTSLVMLHEAEENLHSRGVTLWLAGVNPGVMKLLERSPMAPALARDRVFHDTRAMLGAWQEATA